MDPTRIGIYVNVTESRVVRITSPYWLPEEPEWILVTNDPNATLISVRAMIEEGKLMSDSSGIQWTSLPQLG
jgi:hypothetical protein